MSFSRLLALGAIALALAALLNADDLMRTAEQQPFGWRRDLAVDAADPLRDISHALWLHKPREWIDNLLDREYAEPIDVDDLLADPPPATVPNPPPTEAPSGTPDPTQPPASVTAPEPSTMPPTTVATPALRTPSVEAPLRVWVGGDSMIEVMGQSLARLAEETGIVQTDIDVRYSSGLVRNDFFDWPAHLVDLVETTSPEAMVIMFGANDGQGMELPDGVADFGDERWRAEYTRRVGAVMAFLTSRDIQVFWVGQPIARSSAYSAKMTVLNEVYRSEAEKNTEVHFIESWDLFTDESGGYSDLLRDDDGQLRPMRQEDGIHLTRPGGDRLARVVLDALEQGWTSA